MKTNLFSPILILLILVLFAKASLLFGRIQEQTTYNSDGNNGTSMIVDTAYATNSTQTATVVEGQDKQPQSKKFNVDNNESLLPPLDDSDISNKNESTAITDQSINQFTKSEVELLKELSKRREKLEVDKKDMDIREQVLKATEGKIDQKVSELKGLQSQLEELMKQYDQKENSKILSLVKIYETMKPKDAAKIFNELEMPVLIKVVSNMKEVKVAPIIAGMEPTKARDLSIELARQDPLE
jgi:flagellar motility protein MotE (MotC chaperone)